MRTTLDIADDVLYVARDLGRRQRKSLGEVVSALARHAITDLARPADAALQLREPSPLQAYGITPLAPRGGVVTDDLVKQLREQEGI